LPTRDCFLPVLAVLYEAAKSKAALSAVAASYKLPFAMADRLENFANERSAALMAFIRQSPDNLASFLKPIGVPATVSDIDGLRVTLEDKSIIHFRPSGNAPEMRCYVEAADETASTTLLQAGLKAIETFKA